MLTTTVQAPIRSRARRPLSVTHGKPLTLTNTSPAPLGTLNVLAGMTQAWLIGRVEVTESVNTVLPWPTEDTTPIPAGHGPLALLVMLTQDGAPLCLVPAVRSQRTGRLEPLLGGTHHRVATDPYGFGSLPVEDTFTP